MAAVVVSALALPISGMAASRENRESSRKRKAAPLVGGGGSAASLVVASQVGEDGGGRGKRGGGVGSLLIRSERKDASVTTASRGGIAEDGSDKGQAGRRRAGVGPQGISADGHPDRFAVGREVEYFVPAKTKSGASDKASSGSWYRVNVRKRRTNKTSQLEEALVWYINKDGDAQDKDNPGWVPIAGGVLRSPANEAVRGSKRVRDSPPQGGFSDISAAFQGSQAVVRRGRGRKTSNSGGGRLLAGREMVPAAGVALGDSCSVRLDKIEGFLHDVSSELKRLDNAPRGDGTFSDQVVLQMFQLFEPKISAMVVNT